MLFESRKTCQECEDPCFRFYEVMGVCPKEIGLNSSEEVQEFLDACCYHSSEIASKLHDSEDCCPMFEPQPP